MPLLLDEYVEVAPQEAILQPSSMLSRQEAVSRIEWSFSRRNVLEQCARRYYNEYFGANRRAAKGETAKERLHFLKGLQNRYERAGFIIHLAIATYFRKAQAGDPWDANRLLSFAQSIFRADCDYSRNYHLDAVIPLSQKYPPALLLEYYYKQPDADALCAEAEERMLAGLRAFAAAEVYSTVNRVAVTNRDRPPTDRLECPSERTLYRRIHAAGFATILRPRPSRQERQAARQSGAGPRSQVSRVLERVEIDHTPLDLILVDEEDRQPIGRPTLTLAFDVFSGLVCGFYLGFEPPSYLTVMSCLLHAILPKPDCRQLYGTQHAWAAWGLPETLVVDNGKEFSGRDLDDACAQLGILLERMPVRTPWYKGVVERFFRTLNSGLVHSLPGTTFANSQARGDYDAVGHACIALPACVGLLHTFLLDEYAYRYSRGIAGIPAARWEASAAGGFQPDLPRSAAEVRILLGRTEERTVQRTGIEFHQLYYQCPDLARVRSALPAGTRVRFKYDPADLAAIAVADPTGQQGWIHVPAVDQAYTQGLALWKHLRIQQRTQALQPPEDRETQARARQEIEATAQREYATTRRARGRKQAARLLATRAPAAAETPPAPCGAPVAPAPPAPIADGPPAEWGSDYDLPVASRPPRPGARP